MKDGSATPLLPHESEFMVMVPAVLIVVLRPTDPVLTVPTADVIVPVPFIRIVVVPVTSPVVSWSAQDPEHCT